MVAYSTTGWRAKHGMAAGPGSRPTENENGDPIKVARRHWKETHGIGRRRPQRPALRRPHGVATSSDPKNDTQRSRKTT